MAPRALEKYITVPPQSGNQNRYLDMFRGVIADYLRKNGEGGPAPGDAQAMLGAQAMQKNELLRQEMMRQDPAHFRSLVQRGFDQVQPQEYAPQNAPMAQFIPDSSNPALQMPTYTVSAEAQPVDLNQQRHSDLLWRSWNSPRGQAQQAANVRNDTALHQQLAHLQNAEMPAESGAGDFSQRRALLNALLWATGQGGGLR